MAQCSLICNRIHTRSLPKQREGGYSLSLIVNPSFHSKTMLVFTITWQCYTLTFNLGEAYSAAGNNVEAENWYKASLKSKPDHMAVHLTYAKHLFKIVSTWSVLISILCSNFFGCCLGNASRDGILNKLISKTLERIVISLSHVANVLDNCYSL